MEDAGVVCVMSEPQANRGLINAAASDGEINIGELDPAGELLEPGPGLYRQLMLNAAQSLRACLR